MNALSAMPSLHVAIAFLTVLYFWGKSRAIASVAFAYFLIILAGSVYLGWHYALDGYIGTIMVWTVWALTKPLVAKLHPEWVTPASATRENSP
jgi:membrane-associated phospholipid phosphatase